MHAYRPILNYICPFFFFSGIANGASFSTWKLTYPIDLQTAEPGPMLYQELGRFLPLLESKMIRIKDTENIFETYAAGLSQDPRDFGVILNWRSLR